MKTKLLAALLCFALLLGLGVLPVSAQEAGGFTYEIVEKEAVITGCTLEGDTVTLPEELGGYPVTTVGKDAFRDKTYKTVIVPPSIMRIEDYAFYGCENAAVYLQAERLFCGIRPFVGVDKVFVFDTKSAEYAHGTSFIYDLRDFPCDPWLLEPQQSGSFTYAIYEGEALLMKIAGSGRVIVPDQLGGCPVTWIGSHCRDSQEPMQLFLPDSVRHISYGAFREYGGLELLSLPKSLEYVGESAFRGKKLALNTFPDTLRYVGDRAFLSCGMEDIRLNEGLEYLGERALYGNNVLGITIPSTVTYMGPEAVPAKIMTVLSREVSCKYAFEQTERVIAYAGSTAHAEACRLGIEFEDLETGEAVKTSYTTHIAGIDYRVTGSGAMVISATTKQKNLVLPETVDGKPLIAIRESAFVELPLETIVIPDTVTQLCKWSFDRCKELYSVVMPEGLEMIAEESFSSCKKLSMLYLPESCTAYQRRFYESEHNSGIAAGCTYPFCYMVKKSGKAERLLAGITSSHQVFYTREGCRYLADDWGFYEVEGGEATLIAMYHTSWESSDQEYIGSDTIYSIPVTKVADNAPWVKGNFVAMSLGYYVRELGQGVISNSPVEALAVGPLIQKLPEPLFGNVYSCCIYGYSGTYAERYALEHGIKFYAYGTTSFTDVPKDAWYHDEVTTCYWLGFMNGTSPTTFEPEESTTRAMMAQVLFNMSGAPPHYTRTIFEDVSEGAWYAQAICWCVDNRLAKGVSATRFAPEENVTREQVATFLFRYAEACGFYVLNQAELSGFSDRGKVSAYALDAVEWAVAEGIIRGNDVGKLNPTGYATRAEIAAMLVRFYEYAIEQ